MINYRVPASKLTIRAGEWDTRTKNEPLPHQDRQVSVIHMHPDYHSAALFNDYAILVLNEPVTFADNVDLICLSDEEADIDGSRCVASGWGKTEYGMIPY